ncbi:hypothetical protein CN918_28620 [Priestia megaterium]|nr:hypothetical protein CN918_28620 [Priestia megaterium]
MKFITTIGYHDAYFEVEIVIPEKSATKIEAEKLGNDSKLNMAMLHNDKIVVGKGNKTFFINKQDTHLYQFRVCRLKEDEIQSKGNIVSHDDYESISWDEAISYFNLKYKNCSLPFPLESYFYVVYNKDVVLT